MTESTSTPEVPFEPLFARVLIWREVEEKTKGGIIVVNAKQRSKSQGRVVAVGPTAEGIKVGDNVIFGKYAGTWLDENGCQLDPDDKEQSKGYFICADEDIICVVK